MCFQVKLTKFSRTSILKNICERLLLKISTFQKKLFIDFFHKITITLEVLKSLLSFCAVFANFFIKIFVPPFFVNFLLLNWLITTFSPKIAHTWKNLQLPKSNLQQFTFTQKLSRKKFWTGRKIQLKLF